MTFRLCDDRRFQIDHALAGRADHDLLHVAVGSVQQAALLRRGQHGDGARRAGGAKVGAFQRIDGDVDRGIARRRRCLPDLLADVEHGRFVALAFADDDGAVHGHGIHHAAHGLGGHLVGVLAVALAHGLGRGDGRLFHHAQELQRQVAFQICGRTDVLRRRNFRFSFGRHAGLRELGLRAGRMIATHCGGNERQRKEPSRHESRHEKQGYTLSQAKS